MKSKKYRVGIIGCGRIASDLPDNHFKAYKECEFTEIIALCDIILWQIPWGYKEYTEYMDMVKEENLDIVSVCTPPETHAQIVCDIAPYVKGIYCEKPIALTVEDGQRMIDVCHKYHVILQINHQRLFTIPTFRYSRGIINTGTHMFSLINHLFKSEQEIRILKIDTNEPIFELDCTHNNEPMIPLGVRHLVRCIENQEESISSGEKGLHALKMALKYQLETGCD